MEVTNTNSKGNRLTLYILIAMVAGIALGFVINSNAAGKPNEQVLGVFSLLPDIFLRLVKMIVAPLVFTTLAVGVARQGSLQTVGRVGGKTLLWFVGGSLVSLLLGMLLVNIFQPGANIHFNAAEAAASGTPSHTALTLKEFITHIFPSSFFDAMAKNEILQVVVFSIFFGVAAAAVHDQATIVINALDSAAHIILKMTTYIMNFAPVAVFGAMTVVIARQGLGIIGSLSVFIGEFYIGLLMLFCILMFAAWLFIRGRVKSLLGHIKDPALVAFSTASSEAAFPRLLLQLERFGCDNKVVSFVLPLGYSLNLDGSMMYMTFASLFIAQACGIHLDTASQMTMLLVLMLTSKGIAGVPRASLVVVASTLATFHIPEAGLALILGIDPLLDMGRAAMNVVGNSVATVVVSRWEGALKHHHG